jgi:hypothetical protein
MVRPSAIDLQGDIGVPLRNDLVDGGQVNHRVDAI